MCSWETRSLLVCLFPAPAHLETESTTGWARVLLGATRRASPPPARRTRMQLPSLPRRAGGNSELRRRRRRRRETEALAGRSLQLGMGKPGKQRQSLLRNSSGRVRGRWNTACRKSEMQTVRLYQDGRVVKALDLRSNGQCPRGFEPHSCWGQSYLIRRIRIQKPKEANIGWLRRKHRAHSELLIDNETFSGFLKGFHSALLDLRLQKGKAVFFYHLAMLREKPPWIS
ncbi:uncharacterized protein LOC131515496 [Neofelis nebulosa]|uniref:uncharacterized protein LOC131515496 n=1 Tax=Neofelis nebulosa TaxID=61452 RepID=UPI002729A1CF|nr:uncharacterized protein LOC131515496 [Neofelis nebulosa]